MADFEAVYDENNKTLVITNDGRNINATKYGYGQETLFVGEDGKQYLQNAATLEVYEPPAEIPIDPELIVEPHVAPSAPVIQTVPNPEAEEPQPAQAKTTTKSSTAKEPAKT